MFEVIIDLFELVGQKAELTFRDRVLHAMAHQVAIGGVEKEDAVEWAKQQVKHIVRKTVDAGSESNIEIWAVDSVIEKSELDAQFLFFFTGPTGEYKKYHFDVTVIELEEEGN
jgi:hypothetical protein